MFLRRLTGLALLWVSGCCVPGGETYRAESRVVTHGASAADRVVACTWSSWHDLGAPYPCDDVANGVSEAGDWRVPWFGSRFVTVIFGEAPLMQTVYVACAAGSPIGATFIPWSAVSPSPIVIDLDGLAGINWAESRGANDAMLAALAPRLCAGDAGVAKP
jgi:hypothetical protein